jgi:hypothetical protein
MVDMTARSGETHSRKALKRIRECPHGTVVAGSKVKARQEECERLLNRADRLIEEAASGLARAEARQAALAELQRMQTQLEAAEANLAEILPVHEDEDEDEVLHAVYDTDDAPVPSDISEVLNDAQNAVVGGESVAAALLIRRPRLAKLLLDRAKEAHSRIAALRRRLDALM